MTVPRLPPGLHALVFEPGGRRYALSVPSGAEADRPLPLVLALHWGGPVLPHTGGAMLSGLVEPALSALGALLLAPDRTGEAWTTPRAEAEVLELLDAVSATYPVNPGRTLVTGYSLGGMGTWHLAGRQPDRFAAAIPMAAPPPAGALERSWTLPFHVLHSDADELFPLENTASVVRALASKGAPFSLSVVESVTHFDTGGFAEPLKRTVSWIRKAWGEEPDRS